MNDPELGKVITSEQQRDAIHIAVVPVVADESMMAGQHAGLVSNHQLRVGIIKPYVGIIDPFLPDGVDEDERCWLLLYPGSITSLRHEWSHPAFRYIKDFDPIDAGEASLHSKRELLAKRTELHNAGFTGNMTDKEISAELSGDWLKTFAKTNDCPSYEILIAAATGKSIATSDYYSTAYRIGEEYLHFNGRDAHGEIDPQFWDHVENATGETCPLRPRFFSCNC